MLSLRSCAVFNSGQGLSYSELTWRLSEPSPSRVEMFCPVETPGAIQLLLRPDDCAYFYRDRTQIIYPSGSSHHRPGLWGWLCIFGTHDGMGNNVLFPPLSWPPYPLPRGREVHEASKGWIPSLEPPLGLEPIQPSSAKLSFDPVALCCASLSLLGDTSFSLRSSSTTLVTMSSLTDVCSVANVQAALPANGTILGVNLIPSSVTAAVANASASTGGMGGMAKRDTSSLYCNVTVQYTHTGKDDSVLLWYSFPAPDAYENRFYIGGGGGYSEGTSNPTGGLSYGAVSGSTDSGYSGFENSLDEVVLSGNGSINWDNIIMFSYQAQGETALVGKEMAKGFYGLSSDTKIYTYFEGCSDGGREAMSQAQRYGDVYDGIVAGAPAFHHAQQQVNHLTSSVTEVVTGYFPPPCEMSKIANATIAACDSLDGRTDGVVARTDLCLLNFNLTSIIGESYYCAAATSSSLGFGFSKRAEGSTTSSTPEQNGTVTAEGVALAQKLYSGLTLSTGEQVYLPWQIASTFDDAATTYDNTTASWGVTIPSTGGVFVAKFVELLDEDNVQSLDDVTYETLYEW